MGYEASAHYYDLFGEKPDLQYYTALGTACGSALEVGVGTARVALALAKAGVPVWGIDNSPAMLTIARKKIAEQPESVQKSITVIKADMTDFSLSRMFPLVYMPSSSFSHCVTTKDQLACLQCVHTHLEPGGLFAFDLILPGVYDTTLKLINTKPVGDTQVLRWMQNQPDYTNQVLHTTLLIEVYENCNLLKRVYESSTVALIYKRELLLLLDKAGFAVEHMYGDFEKSETITKTVVVEAKKR